MIYDFKDIGRPLYCFMKLLRSVFVSFHDLENLNFEVLQRLLLFDKTIFFLHIFGISVA